MLTKEQIEALQEYADNEGCEFGDYVNALLDIYERSGATFHESYGASDGFPEAFGELLEKELAYCLKKFETEFRWEETTETKEVTTTYRELVGIYD